MEIGAPSGSCSQSQVNDRGFLLTSAATEAGFDGVIGNPPWEGFKPLRKEFVAKRVEGFSKYTMTGPDFTPWFEKKLKEDADFRAKWEEYSDGYEQYAEYFNRRLEHQGGGDLNLFKLFIEANLALVRTGGQLSLLVPSGLQTDEGCGPLRKLLLQENTLRELSSFENKGYTATEDGKELRKKIFPDVHPQFKFGFFKVLKGIRPGPDHSFDGRFYLHDPKDITVVPVKYSVGMIQRFSPEKFSIMEFRSEADYALCAKVRGEHLLLKEHGHRLGSEFHMTNDSGFFCKREAKKLTPSQLPLYEGKMIHQFDANYTSANYFVIEAKVREELLRKDIHRLARLVRDVKPKKLEGLPTPVNGEDLQKRLREIFSEKEFQLHYERERLVYREIASSTNERTIIAAMVPARVCLNNKLPYLVPLGYELTPKGELKQVAIESGGAGALLALLNSLVLNYYIRSKISATVNMFYVYELPIPKLTAAQRKKLAEAATDLLNQRAEPNLKVMKPAGEFAATRAALEVFIARDLYGLTLEDWKHLTGTFTFGGESETKAELDEIIRQSLALWT